MSKKQTKINPKKLVLLPVPAGLKMRYRYYYKPPVKELVSVVTGVDILQEIIPKKLDMTVAQLEDTAGIIVMEADALVNPKDVPIKALGRCIAHNRCIKRYLNGSHG